MAENSKIEWTDHSWNPWIGCTKVSPGCAHCYAETQDKFRGWTPEGWGKGKPRKLTSDANWKEPLKWNAAADKTVGAPRQRVFCASLADWLDDEVPIEWLARLLAIIHATPNLDWLLLTKRPENFEGRLKEAHATMTVTLAVHHWLLSWVLGKEAPHNVWIGTSVEDQKRANERIPALLNISAKVRFLSCEPLLGAVDLRAMSLEPGTTFRYWPLTGHHIQDGMNERRFHPGSQSIHWVICGGESGPEARPMDWDWATSLRDQCRSDGVPFFFKQWGGTNKKAAGRMLDDREWSEMPQTN
jgi:protein gp37